MKRKLAILGGLGVTAYGFIKLKTRSVISFDSGLDRTDDPKELIEPNFKQQMEYNHELSQLNKIKERSNELYQLSGEKFESMAFLQRVRFYRTVMHYNAIVKKNLPNLRKLIYSIEDELVKDKIEFKFNEAMITELLRQSELIISLADSIKTSNNKYLVNYIFEDPIHCLLNLYGELVYLSRYRERQGIIETMSESQIQLIKQAAEKAKENFENDLIKLDANKVLLNISQDFNFSYMLLNVNKSYLTQKPRQGDPKKKDLNVIFINGLNSVPIKTWRLRYKDENFFRKAKPHMHTCHILDIFNFIFHTNINTTQSLLRSNSREVIQDHLHEIHDVDDHKHSVKEDSLERKFKKIFRFRYHQFSKLWISELLETHKAVVEDSKYNIHFILGEIESKIFEKDLRGIPNFSIKDYACRLKKAIEDSGLVKHDTIYVCHSMGGLIFKEMINKGLDISKIKGTIFFSTPHLGSDVFHKIQETATKSLSTYLRIFDHTIVEEAMENSEIRDIINKLNTSIACNEVCHSSHDYFTALHSQFVDKKIPHCAINETEQSYIQEIGGIFHIVLPESSMLNISNYDQSFFETPFYRKHPSKVLNFYVPEKLHYDVNKMKDANDPAFQVFLEKFQEYKNF